MEDDESVLFPSVPHENAWDRMTLLPHKEIRMMTE
jgi:AMMECR1 domain-containing protein